MRTHLWTKVVAGALTVVAAAGARGQCCGDCNGNGTVAINELVTAVNNALGTCQDGQPERQAFPASGQTTSYGPGSDGEMQSGATLSYSDNGDGTITDNNTGLIWEKKSSDGSIHDKDNQYTWGMQAEPYTMDGTIVTEFLDTLNRPPCFAGHCDWRIPNVRELQSLVDYELPRPGPPGPPTVHAAFHQNCAPSCAVTTCSCTQKGDYWSSTTYQFEPGVAWTVEFYFGDVRGNTKSNLTYVRAVRGSS